MSHPVDAFTGIVHPEVRDYLDHLVGTDPLVEAMEAYAAAHRFPIIGRHAGRTLEVLARATGAKRVFEVGSGFGYSAYFFARGVGVDGRVFATERDAHEHDTHARLFAGHPLRERIDLRHGSALEILAATPGVFDIFLLDCDKREYVAVLEAVLPRLKSGGLVLADNALWGGKVAHTAPEDDLSTRGLQAFNRRIHTDPGLVGTILPVCDGLAAVVKL